MCQPSGPAQAVRGPRGSLARAHPVTCLDPAAPKKLDHLLGEARAQSDSEYAHVPCRPEQPQGGLPVTWAFAGSSPDARLPPLPRENTGALAAGGGRREEEAAPRVGLGVIRPPGIRRDSRSQSPPARSRRAAASGFLARGEDLACSAICGPRGAEPLRPLHPARCAPLSTAHDPLCVQHATHGRIRPLRSNAAHTPAF